MLIVVLEVTRHKKVGSYLERINGKSTLSSVGSEHLPYKQGVLGSNPKGCTRL